MTTRRLRSDGTTGRVHAMRQALTRVNPPAAARLREGDRVFWEIVASSRSPEEWNELDLMVGANLARCLADVERLSGELEAEGDVVGRRPNPKHALIETLTRRTVALTRWLQVHPRGRLGEHRDNAKRRQAWRDAVETLGEHEHDDLIPKG